MNGYWNRILKVNLTEEDFTTFSLPERYFYLYLGGMGIGIRLILDQIRNVDPLSPDNVLLMCPGLLVGTGVPTASKTAFIFKSPLTDTIGRSVAGARAGVALRNSGYDLLFITGRVSEPSVLIIENGKVSIESTDVWGLDIRNAREKLRREYGDFTTAIIGPAGEKKSRIAIIDCDDRQAGRGGPGAVMGSKNLKAILVKGSKQIPVYDKEKLKELNREWRKRLREHPAAKADMDYGTGEFYDWMNREAGAMPSRNWKFSYFKKVYDSLKDNERSRLDPYYWVPRYVKKKTGCPGCNKPCGKFFVVEDGKYACQVDGVEYETLYSLGTNLEIDNIEAVAKANEICDIYGIDTISAGLTLSWVMECLENGVLQDEDLDLNISFGDEDSVLKGLKDIALKKGKTGKILSDGVRKAVERLNKGMEYAIEIKGMELPAYDVRASKGIALAFSVSYRGGCHLTSCIYGVELTGKWWVFDNVDRFSSQGKGYMVKMHEDLMALYDTLGICKFSRHMFYAEGLVDIVHAVTGMNVEVWDLLMAGERIVNMARIFNLREKVEKEKDTLPFRVFNEPITDGKNAGGIIEKGELDEMLEQYYIARGWDGLGRPTKAILHFLGLDDIELEFSRSEPSI